MATVALATDAYFVAGFTEVDQEVPLIIAAGTAANTYTLPGAISVPPGATFPGYSFGTKFTVINLSSNTQTFAAASGYTVSGVTTTTTGASTPTKVTYYYVGGNTWVGF